MEPYRYYYQTMDKTQRRVYEALRSGVFAFSPSVRTLRLPPKELADVLSRLRLDEPRLCFLRDVSFRAVRDAEHVEVIFRYAFEAARARTVLQTVDTRIRKLCLPAAGMDDAAKVKYVHDLLLDTVRYDKLYKNYAHEVIGPLCHGVGVCEGIAKTYKLLLDALGVESVVVIGEENEALRGTEGMRHAWNLVYLSGKPYHVDATFDLSLARCGVRRYDYYCLSDAEIFADHRAPVYAVPPCPDSADYYRAQRLTADTPDALRRLLTRMAKKRGAFAFRWDADASQPFPTEEIVRVCAAFALEKGKRAQLSWNAARRTVLLTLTDAEENTISGGTYEQLPD